jgi:hypothetical protein
MNSIQPHPDYNAEPGAMSHDYLNKRLPAATYLFRVTFIQAFEGVVKATDVRAEGPWLARAEAVRLYPEYRDHRVHIKRLADSREEGLGPEVF